MTTFTKTTELKTGTYQPTGVDAAKAAAQIRIIDADGSYTVRSTVALEGRGIKARGTVGTYEVSKAALARLQKTYSVASDF